MTTTDRSAHPAQVHRFWRTYMTCLARCDVPRNARPWYRKQVERYLAARPELRLRDHTAQHVAGYLVALGARPVSERQFRRLVAALRILFCMQLRVPWCHEVDWAYWLGRSRGLRVHHPGIAGNPGGRGERR